MLLVVIISWKLFILQKGSSTDCMRKVVLPIEWFGSDGVVPSFVSNSYLPGRGDTMIMKVVSPGWGSSIALRMHALMTWLIGHWSHGWSYTDHVPGHALITWLIMHWSRDWSCTDHVADHALITWLSCIQSPRCEVSMFKNIVGCRERESVYKLAI